MTAPFSLIALGWAEEQGLNGDRLLFAAHLVLSGRLTDALPAESPDPALVLLRERVWRGLYLDDIWGDCNWQLP